MPKSINWKLWAIEILIVVFGVYRWNHQEEYLTQHGGEKMRGIDLQMYLAGARSNYGFGFSTNEDGWGGKMELIYPHWVMKAWMPFVWEENLLGFKAMWFTWYWLLVLAYGGIAVALCRRVGGWVLALAGIKLLDWSLQGGNCYAIIAFLSMHPVSLLLAACVKIGVLALGGVIFVKQLLKVMWARESEYAEAERGIILTEWILWLFGAAIVVALCWPSPKAWEVILYGDVGKRPSDLFLVLIALYYLLPKVGGVAHKLKLFINGFTISTAIIFSWFFWLSPATREGFLNLTK